MVFGSTVNVKKKKIIILWNYSSLHLRRINYTIVYYENKKKSPFIIIDLWEIFNYTCSKVK